MPQNSSSQPLKRRVATLRGSNAQNSQPIQPLKLPPPRFYTAAPIPQSTAPADPATRASDVPIADRLDRTVILTHPLPNRLPDILDRPDPRAVKPRLVRQPNQSSSQKSTWQPLQQQRKWGEWSLIGLVAVAGILGGTGTSAMLWLSSLPPLPNCEQVTWRSLDVQRLFCAQAAANSGKLQDLLTGINLLKDWSPDHPLKPEAERLIARWSREILMIAQNEIDHNDLKGAIVTARQVPSSSPTYTEAQKAIAHWQAQWQKGEAAIKVAQNAIQQKKWTQASQQVLVLGELEPVYWRIQRADALSRQILDGKQAQQALIEKQRQQKLIEAQKLIETQRLEAQKVAESGQHQLQEEAIAPIDEQATESTQASTGEALSSLEGSQAVEAESTETDNSFSEEARSDISPTDSNSETSFEGYYDERYFENSY